MTSLFLFLGLLVWDFQSLSKPPAVHPANTTEPGVRAIFYDSVSWQGKPTRVFAYYGAPEHRAGERLPAMVLIHGGGGTAFAEWVRLWNKRGYAAIAMDTCGHQPDAADPSKAWVPVKKRHEHGGPDGWGGFSQVDQPEKDQWTYHAVAAAVLAHSLLRSFPEVDPKRIGVTGISWGGYLTDIVSGVDPRFRFAAPVYGCGYLGEDSAWLKQFAQMGPDRAAKWLKLWDPSEYLPRSKVPMLWVTGTNDFAYPFPSLQKSYRLPKGRRTLAIRVRMPHGHLPGATPEEIHAFANAILRRGEPLPRITAARTVAATLSVRYQSKRPITKAELNYTPDTGKWQDRKWTSQPATLNNNTATATVPPEARAWYLNLFDDRGLVVSSEHETRE
ncbi:MAG: acetylxylan esterase [Bryobacterales bacterium]|nr:acetylxylan esterase [Bryobacterales bacterium]